ncbi:MAG: hypothetical protein F6J90_17985 [Moorea sp. SIOASIH]|uniref:hypothetical protein n=1 Tax=Moorena sp. SIOASIH TaxID=2607817 RepID=UPI0013BA4C1D|nr:hypothetical protein [Moorena sp. SIOASIH]NEO38116.1 hypothetical protein [Moorena sp. SIOASIH]
MGETTAVAHGGDPQDRAASPRPRCLPKTALHRARYRVTTLRCTSLFLPLLPTPFPPLIKGG